MRRLWPLLLSFGCAGPPPAARRAPTPAPLDVSRVNESERPRVAPRPEPPRLLPFSSETVLWYRLERDGQEQGRVAFFLARSRDSGPYLESVGLGGGGEPALRLWRSHDSVWLLPRGLASGAAYRAWAAAALWDQGRGRRGGLEEVDGRMALRVERVVSGLVVKHWFATGVGLVRLEVEDAGRVTWRLDLIEVAPRGAAPRYPSQTPEELWASVREAQRRLDLEGLEALETTALWSRSHPPVHGFGEGRPEELAHQDLEAARVRHVVGELLALRLRPRGSWSIEGDQARLPVTVGRGEGQVAGSAVLLRGPQGWRWDDLVLE